MWFQDKPLAKSWSPQKIPLTCPSSLRKVRNFKQLFTPLRFRMLGPHERTCLHLESSVLFFQAHAENVQRNDRRLQQMDGSTVFEGQDIYAIQLLIYDVSRVCVLYYYVYFDKNIGNYGYIGTSILRIYRIYQRYIDGYSEKKYRQT